MTLNVQAKVSKTWRAHITLERSHGTNWRALVKLLSQCLQVLHARAKVLWCHLELLWIVCVKKKKKKSDLCSSRGSIVLIGSIQEKQKTPTKLGVRLTGANHTPRWVNFFLVEECWRVPSMIWWEKNQWTHRKNLLTLPRKILKPKTSDRWLDQLKSSNRSQIAPWLTGRALDPIKRVRTGNWKYFPWEVILTTSFESRAQVDSHTACWQATRRTFAEVPVGVARHLKLLRRKTLMTTIPPRQKWLL